MFWQNVTDAAAGEHPFYHSVPFTQKGSHLWPPFLKQLSYAHFSALSQPLQHHRILPPEGSFSFFSFFRYFLLQLSIFLRVHRLQPLIGSSLSRHLHRQMGKPAVRRRSMPVLYLRRDIHHIPGIKLLRRFTVSDSSPSPELSPDPRMRGSALPPASLRYLPAPPTGCRSLPAPSWQRYRRESAFPLILNGNSIIITFVAAQRNLKKSWFFQQNCV